MVRLALSSDIDNILELLNQFHNELFNRDLPSIAYEKTKEIVENCDLLLVSERNHVLTGVFAAIEIQDIYKGSVLVELYWYANGGDALRLLQRAEKIADYNDMILRVTGLVSYAGLIERLDKRKGYDMIEVMYERKKQ